MHMTRIECSQAVASPRSPAGPTRVGRRTSQIAGVQQTSLLDLLDVCDKHSSSAVAPAEPADQAAVSPKLQVARVAIASPNSPSSLGQSTFSLLPNSTVTECLIVGVCETPASSAVVPSTKVIEHKLETWIQDLKKRNLKVPRKPGGKLAYATIAKDAGVTLSAFQEKGASRRKISRLANEIGTMPHNDYLESRHGVQARKDRLARTYGEDSARTLATYLDALESSNAVIPESTHVIGVPAYHKVLKAARIRYPTGKKEHAKSRLFRMIDETASRLGLGVRRHRPLRGSNGGTLTYAKAAALLDNGGGASATIARRKSCLSKFRKHYGKLPTDLVGTELGWKFDKTLSELAATYIKPTETALHNGCSFLKRPTSSAPDRYGPS